MNFNLLSVTMFGVGALLLYSGIRDVNPKDVITEAMQGRTAKSTSVGGDFPKNEKPALTPNPWVLPDDDSGGSTSVGGTFGNSTGFVVPSV